MNSAKYYYAQEGAYKKIQANGGISWGDRDGIDQFRDPVTEKFLKSVIAKFYPDTKSLTALDIGSGSGPTAHMLCDLGFSVLGIDVSETAIQMAKKLAIQFDKDIHFRSADLLEIKNEGQKFDLLYDSHCFHCIVDIADRKNAFKSAKALLKPGGHFILDTMVYREGADMCGGVETLKFDSDFILWHKTNKNNFSGIVEVDGQLWCPQRRIYPENKVLAEIAKFGFKIQYRELFGDDPNDCYMLRLVCS